MRTPPPPEITCGFLIQLVFCKKKNMWFIGVEVEQETSAPPPKKNPGSAPGMVGIRHLSKVENGLFYLLFPLKHYTYCHIKTVKI